MLGVYQTPERDFSTHIQLLKEKAVKFAGYIKSPRLTPTDIAVFHKTIYTPSMMYSLPAIAADEEELEKVQTRIMPSIVQRLGYCSTLPTAIRHGPDLMGGLNLIDLRTECGISMINYLRHAIHHQSQVGKLILIRLATSQLESGLPNLLLEEPSLHIPYLTPVWILSLRQYMSNHNVTITLTQASGAQLQSPSDSFIMDLTRLKGYSTREQQDLNLVRIFLQVTTLNDLTDPTDGSRISNWAFTATRPSSFEPSKQWPRQPSISPTQRRLWRRYISSQFLRYDRLWIKTPRPRLRDLKSLLPPTPRGDETPPSKDIATHIDTLPSHARRLLTVVNQIASTEDITSTCESPSTLTIASDGGLKGTCGTFGWQLSTSTNQVLFEGAGPIDGPFDTNSSTRCEIGGYAAALLLLSMLHKTTSFHLDTSLRWVTDSKPAISNVTKSTQTLPSKTQRGSADYLAMIRESYAKLPFVPSSVWVKGHQTRNCTTTSADVDRNNRADSLATWYREDSGKSQSSEKVDHVPSSLISISIMGKRLTNQIESCLRFHVNSYHLRHYLQNKFEWADSIWDSLDWESAGMFNRRLPAPEKAFHTKLAFDQLNVGTSRLQRATVKDEHLAHCPC